MQNRTFSARLVTRELGYRRWLVKRSDRRAWRVTHNVVTGRIDIVTDARSVRVFEFSGLGLAILDAVEAETKRLELDEDARPATVSASVSQSDGAGSTAYASPR